MKIVVALVILGITLTMPMAFAHPPVHSIPSPNHPLVHPPLPPHSHPPVHPQTCHTPNPPKENNPDENPPEYCTFGQYPYQSGFSLFNNGLSVNGKSFDIGNYDNVVNYSFKPLSVNNLHFQVYCDYFGYTFKGMTIFFIPKGKDVKQSNEEFSVSWVKGNKALVNDKNNTLISADAMMNLNGSYNDVNYELVTDKDLNKYNLLARVYNQNNAVTDDQIFLKP